MQWLTEVPLAVVEAHLVMLPRIEAEESLDALRVSAIGGSSFESGAGWMKDQIKQWEDAVKGVVLEVKRGVPAGVGIGVRKVKRG